MTQRPGYPFRNALPLLIALVPIDVVAGTETNPFATNTRPAPSNTFERDANPSLGTDLGPPTHPVKTASSRAQRYFDRIRPANAALSVSVVLAGGSGPYGSSGTRSTVMARNPNPMGQGRLSGNTATQVNAAPGLTAFRVSLSEELTAKDMRHRRLLAASQEPHAMCVGGHSTVTRSPTSRLILARPVANFAAGRLLPRPHSGHPLTAVVPPAGDGPKKSHGTARRNPTVPGAGWVSVKRDLTAEPRDTEGQCG